MGATTALSCTLCHGNSSSFGGSAQCDCNAGYFLNARDNDYKCNPCAPGYYKPEIGAANCTPCATSSYQESSAATFCRPCRENSTSKIASNDIDDCFCVAGYGFVPGFRADEPETHIATCVSAEKLGPSCTVKFNRSFSPIDKMDLMVEIEQSDFASAAEFVSAVSINSQPYGSEYLVNDGSDDMCGSFVQLFRVDLDSKSAFPLVSISKLASQQGYLAVKVDTSVSVGGLICYGATLRVRATIRVFGLQPSCMSCRAGEFKPSTENENCTLCSKNSYTVERGSTLRTECLCNAGYSGQDGAACSACVPGLYKSTQGNASCIACVAGKFSPSSAADREASCQNCSAHSTSSAGDTQCLCNTGYTGVFNSAKGCQACEVGTFKAANGSAGCSDCPAGKYSSFIAAGTESSCAACPAGSNSPAASWAADKCLCNVGYTLGLNVVDFLCLPCPPGTYKHVNGTGFCVQCVAGKYSEEIAADSADTCLNCSAYSYSGEGSARCLCDKGYTGVLDSLEVAMGCRACPAGTFKEVNGSAACRLCDAGKFSELVAADVNSTCRACPSSHSLSSPGSSSVDLCVCNVGYAGPNGGDCTGCAPGTYKNVNGSSKCMKCTAGTFSAATAADSADSCLVCSARSWSVVGDTVCLCDPGHFGVANSEKGCQPCPGGMFAAFNGSSECSTCPNNTYSNGTGSSACLLCHATTASVAGSMWRKDCLCRLGFTGADGGECYSCEAGTFKNTRGSSKCSPCFDFSFSESGSKLVSDCKCNAGYSGPDGGSCSFCVEGTYKVSRGPQACNQCRKGTYSTSIAQATGDTCTVCPPDTTTALTGAGSIDKCGCAWGFTGPNAGPCEPCAAGKYKEVVGNVLCSNCPYHSSSPSKTLNNLDCRCNAGYTGDNGKECVACDPGKFKEEPGDHTCSTCAYDTYSTGGAPVCTECPANSTAAPASEALAACFCVLGYTGALGIANDGATCEPCPAGTYKSVHGNVACEPCPADQYQAEPGSSACTTCPAGTFSAKESMSLSNCSCQKGFTPTDDVSCTPCLPGTFKAQAGAGSCTSCPPGKYSSGSQQVSEHACQECPAFSWSQAASETVLDCVCKLGYVGPDGGLCQACPSGSFGVAFSDTKGCQPCPDHSHHNMPGSSDTGACMCNAGYTGLPSVGKACVPCASGTFKAEPGNATCQSCARGTYNPFVASNGVSACLECPTHSSTMLEARNSISDCVCNAGHAGNIGEPCAPCAAGTFKATTGSQSCLHCKAGKFGPEVAQVSEDACSSCPPNSFSPSASSSVAMCICDAGYYARGTQTFNCSACPAGAYKAVQGPNTCDLCARGKYSVGVAQTSQATCVSCPSNSSSIVGSSRLSMCLCLSGFSLEQDSESALCAPCKEGTYKTVHNSACIACGAGKYSSEAAQKVEASCRYCPAHSESPEGSRSSTSCLCIAGYTGINGEKCVACEAGTYKARNGSSACLSCDAGTHSNGTGSSTCQQCPANSQAPPKSSQLSECLCAAGHTGPNGGSCLECRAGEYKAVVGSSVCVQCEAGLYSNSVRAHKCKPCPAFATSPGLGSSSLMQCKCNPGYSGPDGGSCLACQKGSYKSATGSFPCLTCARGSYSADASALCSMCPRNSQSPTASISIQSCVCNAGFYGVNGGECFECPAGWVCQGGSRIACAENSSSSKSSSELKDCVCEPGLEGPPGGPCRLCTAGTYCLAGGLYQCPRDTTSAVGSSESSHCTCSSGFYAPGGVLCQACSADTYCPGGRQATRCPINSQSQPGATNVYACKCNAGFFGPDGGPCTWCPRYYYCTGGDHQEVCQTRGDSPPGSSTLEHCSCERGFFGEPGGACQECTEDRYCPGGTGNFACPAGTESYRGSWGLEDCTCERGTKGDPGGPCSGCEVNTFCFAGREFPCPERSASRAGSVDLQSCVCNAGSYGLATQGPCHPCEAGFYCPGGDIRRECLANSRTVTNSATVNDCLCLPGFSGPAGGPCLACEPDSFKPYGDFPCTCNAGYTGADESTCRACAPGTFKAESGSKECQPCAAGKYGTQAASRTERACISCPSGSDSLPSSIVCQCAKGYSLLQDEQDSQCKACGAGKYKSAISSNADCADCPRGTYSAGTAADSTLTCKPCAQNSWTAASGSTDKVQCLCNLGYEGEDGGLCVACTPGSYKSTVGSAPCALCPASSFSSQAGAASAATCRACAPNSQSSAGSVSNTDCRCLSGYSGALGGPCVACPPGSYKKLAGTESCTQCPEDFFSTELGAISANACRECPLNSVSPWGSSGETDCRCARGFFGPNGGPCTPCAPGSFSSVPGSLKCDLCASGKYSEATRATAESSCKLCAAYSISPQGSSSKSRCLCLDDFEGRDGGPCTACTPGTFKAGKGSTKCSSCEGGLKKYPSAPNVFPPTCLPCPLHATPVDINTVAQTARCECDPGYTGNNGDACPPCASGKFKLTLGSAACSDCPAATYSSVLGASSSDDCQSCPANSESPPGSAQCFCKGKSESTAGFFGPDGGPCVACPIGSVKTSPGPSPCLCGQGFFGEDAGSCAPCPVGTYKLSAGTGNCTGCPPGTFWSNSVSHGTNSRNYTVAQGTAATCFLCPSSSTSKMEGSTSVLNCQCNAGFTGEDGQACSACPKGSYKQSAGSLGCDLCPAGTYNSLLSAYNLSACLSCPANSWSPQGGVDASHCQCNSGFAGPNGGTCTVCSAGSTKTNNGSALCIACLPGTFSEAANAPCVGCPSADSWSSAGSFGVESCKCNVGYSGMDGSDECIACPFGTFKQAMGSMRCQECEAHFFASLQASTSCTRCPDDSVSVAGSTSIAACECKKGFQGSEKQAKFHENVSTATLPWCVPCTPGTYKDVLGSPSCAACPANAHSPALSINLVSCVCNGGYTGADGGTCTGCAKGKYWYKPPAESAVCLGCDPGTYSVGIAMRNKTACVNCPVNTYSAMSSAAGLEACLLCKPGAIAPKGSVLRTDCECASGFFGPAGGPCLACMAGSFKSAPGPLACTLCESGKYSVATGTTTPATCVACQSNSSAPPGSVEAIDCQCNRGYSPRAGKNRTCAACPVGSFKMSIGFEQCKLCPAGKYMPAGTEGAISEDNCLKCPANFFCTPNKAVACPVNTTSNPGSSEASSCVCAPGYASATSRAPCKKKPVPTLKCGWTCNTGPCISLCGDGIRADGGEDCDDGNTNNGDGCDSLCRIELGWECLPYVTTEPCGIDQCSETCGDGYVVGKESCDDSNLRSGDGCSEVCAFECCFERLLRPGGSTFTTRMTTRCGDGCWAGSEECDDGNSDDGDGCSSACKVERGWICLNSNCGKDHCAPKCSDGRLGANESCDDGNDRNHDGCSQDCHVEPGFHAMGIIVASACGDGVWTGSEMCDDGNDRDNDGCSGSCVIEPGFICFNTGLGSDRCDSICGDGRRVGNETCDDGNEVDGDGCDGHCQIESLFRCRGGSGVAADYCTALVPTIECSRMKLQQAARESNDMGFVLTSHLLPTSSKADYKTIEIVPAALRSWSNAFVTSFSAFPDKLYVPVPVFAAGTWVQIRVRAENSFGAGVFCEAPNAVQLMGLPGPAQNLHLQYSNAKESRPLCVFWLVPENIGLGKLMTSRATPARTNSTTTPATTRIPSPRRLLVVHQRKRNGVESYRGQVSPVSSFAHASEFEVATNAQLCFPAPPGTSWYFRVIACNRAGCFPFDSAPVASFSVPAELPPPSPPAGSMRIFSVSPSQAPW